jgi:hypothetical protein
MSPPNVNRDMSFFSWAKHLFGFSDDAVEERSEISTLRHLESMRKAHSLLDIRVPRLNGLRCQSIVLDVNPEEGYLTLDEPFPYASLESGDTLHITCRIKNRSPVEFNSTLLRKQNQNGNTNYLLELPESIQGDGPLDNYRIYVEKENISLELTIDDEIIQSQVIAISFDSIKFHILGQHSDKLSEAKLFKGCFLRLPDELIECSITVQQSFDLSRPLLHTLCTAKLELDQRVDNKKFNHYLASLQRQQRRRELRLT